MVTRYTDYEIQHYFGLSTDDKPTDDVLNGSDFFEMDTKETFYYDEDHTEWI